MKKLLSILIGFIFVLSLNTCALAWSGATPPSTSNTGSLSSTGVSVGFGTNGISSSIDTTKCYTGIGTYKVKAAGLYLANDSLKLCTVKIGVNYWNTDKEVWQAGNRYSKQLPATNVKDSSGNYQPVKQDISSQEVSAQGKSMHHYGVFTKDYTSIKMYGSFTLSK